jgi:delta 1-pyrroline-5-carboxylate dehydrogenase
MAESRLGNPERLSVDIGPVIDAEAKAGIEKHIQGMRDKGRSVYQVAIADSEEIKRGTLRDANPDRAGKLRRTATRDLRPGAARGALQA